MTYTIRVIDAIDCRNQLANELDRLADVELSHQNIATKKSDKTCCVAKSNALTDAAKFLRDINIEMVVMVTADVHDTTDDELEQALR